jgi:hypothetical protein
LSVSGIFAKCRYAQFNSNRRDEEDDVNDFQTISRNLVKSLSLQYKPVGVLLYQETDPLDMANPIAMMKKQNAGS